MRPDNELSWTPAPSSPYLAYLRDSTLPLNALIFLSPVLLVYHLGIWWLQSLDWRVANGADVMLAKILNFFYLGGIKVLAYYAPTYAQPDSLAVGFLQTFSSLLALLLLVFCLLLRQHFVVGKWQFKPRVFALMFFESGLFALPLFLLDWGVRYGQLSAVVGDIARSGEKINGELVRVVLSMGAGVYEEFLFRWLLMGALFYLFATGLKFSTSITYYLAMLLQAFAFAGFHYLPWSTETFVFSAFIFRVLSGLYFGYLYQERKFAIAAGAHVIYNVCVVGLRNL